MVEDGKVKYLGDYDKIMNKSDEKINLQGYTVLPGFIDSHTHLIEMGLNLTRVDLSDTASFQEACYFLNKEVKKTDAGEWVVGTDFDETKWKMNEYPTKDDLDEVSEEHPLLMKRVCGHIAVVNSAGLDEIDEEWGRVDRETGVIKEEPVWNLDEIMGIGQEEKKEAIEKGLEKAHRLGVTGIHDIVDKDGWEAYVSYDDDESLDMRVRCYLHFDEIDDLSPQDHSQCLSLRGVKLFVDGSMGARTAALEEDYADDPGNRGTLLLSQEEIEDVIREAEAKGFQVMAHAIGDRAISTVLDAFEATASRIEELRHRIEHAEVLTQKNIQRIRSLDITLSTQPNFAYRWSQSGGMNEHRLGRERLERCDPYWDIQRSLVKMTFGSDNMPMSPLFGVYSAVNHPILNQRISTYNALHSYITNGAYASRDEDRFGEIQNGMYADFVVLSENPLDSEDIKDIDVIMTVVNGKIVYDGRDEEEK